MSGSLTDPDMRRQSLSRLPPTISTSSSTPQTIALGSLAGLVYRKDPTPCRRAVDRVNRGLALGIVQKLDKAKSPWSATFAVHGQVRVRYFPMLREQFLQLLLFRVK